MASLLNQVTDEINTAYFTVMRTHDRRVKAHQKGLDQRTEGILPQGLRIKLSPQKWPAAIPLDVQQTYNNSEQEHLEQFLWTIHDARTALLGQDAERLLQMRSAYESLDFLKDALIDKIPALADEEDFLATYTKELHLLLSRTAQQRAQTQLEHPDLFSSPSVSHTLDMELEGDPVLSPLLLSPRPPKPPVASPATLTNLMLQMEKLTQLVHTKLNSVSTTQQDSKTLNPKGLANPTQAIHRNDFTRHTRHTHQDHQEKRWSPDRSRGRSVSKHVSFPQDRRPSSSMLPREPSQARSRSPSRFQPRNSSRHYLWSPSTDGRGGRARSRPRELPPNQSPQDPRRLQHPRSYHRFSYDTEEREPPGDYRQHYRRGRSRDRYA
jgi:hypothetical protein